MSPLSGGQRGQAGVVTSLGGSSVEECAEATVDIHLLNAPSLSSVSVFSCEGPVNKLTDPHLCM